MHMGAWPCARSRTQAPRGLASRSGILMPVCGNDPGVSDTTPATGLTSLPLFDPSHAAANGLQLLAAAVTASTTASTGKAQSGAQTPPPSLIKPGPFNPAASLPTKRLRGDVRGDSRH